MFRFCSATTVQILDSSISCLCLFGTNPLPIMPHKESTGIGGFPRKLLLIIYHLNLTQFSHEMMLKFIVSSWCINNFGGLVFFEMTGWHLHKHTHHLNLHFRSAVPTEVPLPFVNTNTKTALSNSFSPLAGVGSGNREQLSCPL